MLSDIVCSGTRQNFRTTRGGTTAAHATTAQFVTDVNPVATATRETAIAQATKSSVLTVSEAMKQCSHQQFRGLFRIARVRPGDLPVA